MKSKALSLHPMKFKDAIKRVVQIKPGSQAGSKAKAGKPSSP
jgi:hypothetical protein